MLSLFRLQSTARPCLRALTRPTTNVVCRRAIASSSLRRNEEASTTTELQPAVQGEQSLEFEEDSEDANASSGGSGEAISSYRVFMEKIGQQYEVAQPNHWMGGQVPFPMNPSFKPPPPISDRQRQLMWQMYLDDKRTKSAVRRLSKTFNLSLKRVTAILRLKVMEVGFRKKKPLQTGFQVGMEKLLNVQTHPGVPRLERATAIKDRETLTTSEEYIDVHRADVLEQEESRDSTKLAYERLYWESIAEDKQEPSLPAVLQHVKKTAEYKALASEAERNKNARFFTKVPSASHLARPSSRIITRRRPSGPTMQFVDVGARFMDMGEHLKRLAASERRSAFRSKKAVEKQ